MSLPKRPARNGNILNLFLRKRSLQESQDTKTKKSPILLIDGSVLCYMALFVYGHLSYNGKNTGVVYGVLQKILSLANKFKTNDFVICWDSKDNHREKIYPQYKSQRKANREKKTPEEQQAFISLGHQRDGLIQYILPALGFKNNFIRNGYEGDDLLAWWALKLGKKHRVVMVTSDADMYQCLDFCDIWNPQKKKFFTKKNLLMQFGVLPNQWALAKAIGGCSGDGVIGVKGVSDPKSPLSKALQYIKGKLKKGKIFDRIESKDGQMIIRRNLSLVSLPFDNKMKKMILRRNKYNRKEFLKIFDELHFKSFLEKDNFSKWEKIFLDKKGGV